MKKPVNAVKLPTEDLSNIIKRGDDNSLVYYGLPNEANKQHSNQHVYITVSQDIEPIKEGDWGIKVTVHGTFLIQCVSEYEPKAGTSNWRKIIATNDPKLTGLASNGMRMCLHKGWNQNKAGNLICDGTCRVPQLQQSFLKEFVANPDGEWEVEYETKQICPDYPSLHGGKRFKLCEACHNHSYLKLNQDNTVTITSVEEKMYSEEEVKNFGLFLGQLPKKTLKQKTIDSLFEDWLK